MRRRLNWVKKSSVIYKKSSLPKRQTLQPKKPNSFSRFILNYRIKKTALNKEAWKKIRKGKEENVSESEYGQLIEDVIETRIQIDKLDLEYVRKYKKILSAKKIFEIQRAENEISPRAPET